jgi:hypothetical protein
MASGGEPRALPWAGMIDAFGVIAMPRPWVSILVLKNSVLHPDADDGPFRP